MNHFTGAKAPHDSLYCCRSLLHYLFAFILLGIASRSDAGSLPAQFNLTITSPTNGETFKSGRDITLMARAVNPHEPIRRVDYYEATNLLASSSRSDFRAIWHNAPPGLHSIFAVAIDNHGRTIVSAPVQISVIPSNDNFSEATVLAGTDVSIVGSTIGATLENGEPDWSYGGASIWYSWTAPAHGRVRLASLNWPNVPYFGACTGDTVSNLTLAADNLAPWGSLLSEFYFEVQTGTTYHVVVAGQGGPISAFSLSLDFLPRPANDDFESRATIPAWGGKATADNSFATFEPGEPSDLSPYIVGYTPSFHTVWWTWTAPVAGQVNIQPSGDFIHALGVYSGLVLSNLTTITTTLFGGASLDVSAGTTLQISVDGVSGQTGVVNLNVGFTPAPSNDDFKNSKRVFGDKATLQGDNTAATHEPGEPLHSPNSSERSVWWNWVAPASGYVTLNPAENSAIPVVAVYTRSPVSNLTAVASSPDGTVAFDAIEGRTYHIAVDSMYGVQGPFTLNLLLSTIRLTKPLPDALFYVGDPIVLAAKTTRLDGYAKEVDFFAGMQFLGSAPGQHPTVTWTNAGLGAYSLTASTIDRQGIIRRSKPVNIRVRPANDDFSNSFVIQGLNVVTNGTNLGASKEFEEPTGGDPSADASVWYTWTAPVSGVAVASIGENFFAGHPLGVYLGNSVSNLVTLGESVWNFFPVSFVAHAGVTYHIEVSGFSSDPPDGFGPFTLGLNQTPAPPNDDFANRIILSGNPLTFTGSNVGATSEPGEPASDPSVWWSWTASGTGSLYLNATGDSLGPVLTVFTGDSLTNLQSVGSAHPSWYDGTDSSGEIHVKAGVTYQIRLSGTYVWPVGKATIDLSFAPSPPNDDFADRYILTGSTAFGTSSNVTASAEAGETNSLGRTVWWSWTATNSGPVTLGTGGSSFIPWVAVYTGTDITNLVLVANGTSGFTFTALAGTTYSISVDANYYEGQIGQIQLTLVAGPPPNDDFKNRISLSGTNVTVVGSTVGATEEPLEPVHGGLSGTNSIWWTWTAPATGTLNVSVTGDGFKPTWSIYTGTGLNTLALLADSYSFPWNPRSTGTVPVQQGASYQIAVDGSLQTGGPPEGIVNMNLVFYGLPPNDNFANRISITNTVTTVNGTTERATKEPGEPDHDGYSGGHSIWYSFTAPSPGYLQLDTFGSSLTTLVGVYTGDVVSNLTNVASGNASYAPVVFPCVPGTIYQIALDHWYSDMSGPVVLNLRFSTLGLEIPTDGSVFYGTSPITLAARVTPSDGPFTELDFLSDGVVVGSITNATQTFVWVNPPLGDHLLQVSLVNTNTITETSPGIVIHIRPANDDFANAAVLVVGNGFTNGSTTGGTLEPNEPLSGYTVPASSVWYSWIAPTAGRYHVALESSAYVSQYTLEVFTGTRLPNLVHVGTNLSYSLIELNAVAGATYYVAIVNNPSFSLAVDLVPLPHQNDDFEQVSVPSGITHLPVLSQPLRLSPTQFSFVLSAAPGSNYSILVSTNLSASDPGWNTLTTTNLSGNSAIIQDNGATNGQRFYRVRVGP